MNLGGVIHLNKTGICMLLIICGLFFLYFFSHSASTSLSSEAKAKKRIDLNDLLHIAIKAAQNGGKEILNVKDTMKIASKGKTKEGINDPVTTADYNSHCAMLSTLHHKYPNLEIVSEEANTECDKTLTYDYTDAKQTNFVETAEPNLIDTQDLTVWIDPLDATKEFTEGLYKYVTTMVCVAANGKPIIGVIHKPFEDKTFWAWVGNPNRNLEFHIKARTSPKSKPTVIVSMSHKGTIEQTLNEKFKDGVNIITAAGAGYKVLEVVAGRADAYLHSTIIKKWDICAGNAILNAVDGHMTTKNNKIITYHKNDQVQNTDGLIATIKDHSRFIGNF